MQTFAEMYCERQHLAPERFVRSVFWRCLYRHALPLAPLFLILNEEYFSADFDLIAAVGRSSALNGLHEDLFDFSMDSRNRGFLRRRLRIRISGARLSDLVHRTREAEAASPPREIPPEVRARTD